MNVSQVYSYYLEYLIPVIFFAYEIIQKHGAIFVNIFINHLSYSRLITHLGEFYINIRC